MLSKPATLRNLLGAITLLAVAGWILSRFHFPAIPTAPSLDNLRPFRHVEKAAVSNITKVSILYGERNENYEGAVESHLRHAKRQGYPVHVLRNDIARGFWNKPTYLLSILVQELSKPVEERAQWIWWFDADTIILNSRLAVEMFLPPDDGSYDHIHFIGTKDASGLNTGVFFLRVHEWSARMLTKTTGFPLFRPEIDLGRSADQQAMAMLFNETDFRHNVLFQPRIWYNTYEFSHGYEGEKGRLLVHFPGLEQERWAHMEKWLRIVADTPEEWEADLADTMYPAEIETFWSELGSAREMLRRADDFVNRHQQAQEAKVREEQDRQRERQKQDQKEEGQGQAGQPTAKAKPTPTSIEPPPAELTNAIQLLSTVMETETDRLDAVREARAALDGTLSRLMPAQ